MPGLLDTRKRSPDGDSDGYVSDHTLASDSDAPSASKRPRTNGHVANGAILPESYLSDQSTMSNGHAAASTLAHQPGSIVRVTLRDFVTYTRAEFNLGPSLNMVIGPNGTGKSTLVCAICLGLGWKTEHLGRAKDVGEFVKHGASEAEIEIELAADPERHNTNPVIKLNIKKSNSKTTFFLNGRTVPRKAILDECKAFSIQIDNLCQFLPQDRVVEFAALSPVDLLTQTQRAAAPPEMTDMHDQLKSMHVDQKRAINDQTTLADSLKNLESRQNLQRTDVERLQQRVQCQEELEALELYRPSLQYKAAKERFDTIKEQRQAASRAFEQLQQEVEPALSAVNDKREYHEKIDEAVQQRTRVLKRSEEHLKLELKKQDDLSEKIKSNLQEVTSEENRVKQFKQDRARCDGIIKSIEVRMREEPPQFDAADYNERLRGFTREKRDLEERASEANAKQENCVRQIRQRSERIDGLNKELDGLKSKAGQQMNKLKRASMDTYKAWEWIERHQDLFQGPILGPPIITLSVKDQRNAIYVESLMTGTDFLGITATNPADFKLLQAKLAGEQRLTDIYLRSATGDLSRYRQPVASADLRSLGLDCYVIDLLEGPNEVLGMLCDTRNIHQTAVTFKNLSTEQHEAVTRSNISAFITPTETYTITRRREYGDRGVSTRTRKLRPAQFFTDQQVDTGAEQDLKAQIRELQGDIEDLKKEGLTHKDTSRSLAPRHKELEEAQKELQEEKDQKQKALAIYNGLGSKLQTEKEKLDGITEKIAQAGQIRVVKQKENAELITKKSEGAIMFATSVRTLQKNHTALFEAELQLIEAQSDLETLEARNIEVRRLLEESQKQLEELDIAKHRAREEAKVFIEKAQQAAHRLSDRQREIHGQQPEGMTIEALEEAIVALQARLELVHEGNPNVMREYEDRGRKIEKSRERLDTLTAEVNTFSEKIQAIRERWEPELDALITKISDAFGDNMSRINCAGHVEVEKTEDFAEWAILIKVKFRENEVLSVLDAHRQSGGERAVSTIFYLMALQSLARAPFRVVDEINQGMDPRNERLVHSRMVSIACAENTSQYFLITPKLLPNLTYHPNMKIHCIASGEYLPEDYKQLNFQTLAQKALGVQRRISGRV